MNHIAYYLREIHFRKRTGQLLFKRGNITKNFFFQGGELIFARTNLPEEELGEILVRRGKILEREYLKIRQSLEPRQKIEDILLQKELVSQKDLYEGMIAQLKEMTLSIFPFFDAEIDFEEKGRFVEKDLKSKISVISLIEGGIRKMPYHPSLRTFMEKKIPYSKVRIHLTLQEEEKKILEVIDGKNPTEALLPSAGLSPDLFWKSLYLLFCLDLIDFRVAESIPVEERTRVAPPSGPQTQLAEVLALAEKLQSMNYYQILNVSRDASDAEIKKVYFHLARMFHPDSFDQNLPAETKEQIDEVFDQITKAYKTLSNKEERTVYDRKLATALPEEGRDVGRKADIKFRQGKTLFNQGRYEDAIIFLEEAVRLRPNKSDYFLLLAMAESKLPLFRKKAEEDFLKAIDLEPWNAEAYIGLGLFYKQEGLPAKASRQFRRAVDIDPEHKVALKELNLLRKEEKKKGLKALLSTDLFGRKKK